MSLAEDLYETDYYAWALEQAELLRRRAAGDNALDYKNLAEEVEGLGQSQLNACRSLLRQIVKHFIKIALADDVEAGRDVRHWRQEIGEFRLQIESYMTRSLRLKLEGTADDDIARQIKLMKYEDEMITVQWLLDPPGLEQCLAEDTFPIPGSRTLRAQPLEAAPD